MIVYCNTLRTIPCKSCTRYFSIPGTSVCLLYGTGNILTSFTICLKLCYLKSLLVVQSIVKVVGPHLKTSKVRTSLGLFYGIRITLKEGV